ncbi:hypothetical protein RvY_16320 [Ramazzottius varieornatus]|uniref:Uncharacterized protein n=1 Tax=Ramazzottius varieornatus TaxID=947166 RepID=A0A1D1VZB7_RAMVA|nr:hypothetical protein RvY_16320 [Ramazzottius varieornatus]
MSDHGFVPATFIRYLWLFGLYHPVKQDGFNELANPKPRLRCKNVYGYVAATLTSMMCLVGLAEYNIFYIKDIATMYFFVLVRVLNNSLILLQTPLILLSLFSSRRRVEETYNRFCVIDISIFTQRKADMLRKALSVLTLV